MNQRLKEAASSGDIDSLYSIIQEDAYILDRVDQVPFVDTPLHISASAGLVHFSLEIMRLKPSFAKKLNPEGYSPIHLALQNNQTETVLQLVDIDRDLVSIQGREGLTPMHIAASGGNYDILAKFLISCPKSIKELTIRRESTLHIAVKNGDIESLKILLEWIQQESMSSILNWTDEEGNTIMHLAALRNQIEMVKLLLTHKVDIKSKNFEGMTALDILIEQRLLEDNNELVQKQSRLANMFWLTLSFMKRLVLPDHHEIIRTSKEDRNAVLVVSVLIATASYQALLTPPDAINEYFRYFNTLAFVGSMVEICLHLPCGIGYAVRLVLPLVICYALLMVLVWWRASYIVVNAAAFTFVIMMKKFPQFRQKMTEDLKSKKLINLGACFNRNPSSERELTEINVHFRRNNV